MYIFLDMYLTIINQLASVPCFCLVFFCFFNFTQSLQLPVTNFISFSQIPGKTFSNSCIIKKTYIATVVFTKGFKHRVTSFRLLLCTILVGIKSNLHS